jgi:hypothetical protein
MTRLIIGAIILSATVGTIIAKSYHILTRYTGPSATEFRQRTEEMVHAHEDFVSGVDSALIMIRRYDAELDSLRQNLRHVGS